MSKKNKIVFRSRNASRDTKLGYMFLAPWIIGLFIFTLIPLIMTIIYSFADVKNTNFGFEYDFVGMAHYSQAFLGNLDFDANLLDFIKMEFSYVPVILIVSFIIANILNSKIKGRTFFRIVFFLPVIIISGSLISVIFPNIQSQVTSDSGAVLVKASSPLDSSFIYLIIESYSTAFSNLIRYVYTNFVRILWFTGIPIVLFINGLNRINGNLYEAAQIDGANRWQMLWKITIPNVRMLSVIISVFSVVQLSIMPTSSMYTLIKDSLKDSSMYGTTAAYSAIYAITIILIILVFFLILRPKEKKPTRTRITRLQKKGKEESMKRLMEAAHEKEEQ